MPPRTRTDRALPLLLLLTALTACQQGARREGASPPDSTARAATAPPPDTAARADTARPAALISPTGIGEARAGMTIGALRAALPAGTTLGAAAPFMVDISALPVTRGADTLYLVLVVAGEPSDDGAPISTVATRNPAFHTAEGIGPGSTLAEAVAAYGAATVSYSTNDESREYAAFAGYPHPEIHFRVDAGSSATGFAGRYATRGEYNTTRDYDPSARISLVTVDLRGDPSAEPEAPWSRPRLGADEAPAVYLTEWRRAENRAGCAPLAPAALGAGEGATPRAASFSGGWGVAYDLPRLRSAFGVAGAGVLAADSSYSDWPFHLHWADGGSAGYGPEGGTGPNQLAYLRIPGQTCLYNVWSRLGREHLELLLSELRFIEPGGSRRR
jgi:hypothetical protein